MDEQQLIRHAKEQERNVRLALSELHMALLELDTVHHDGTNTSFHMDFNEQDMFHATSIMFSVCSNYAIKHKLLTKENAEAQISKFRELVKEVFGLDTIAEAQIAVMCHQTNRAEA